MSLSRRDFLSACATGASFATLASPSFDRKDWLWAFLPGAGIENPLAHYPTRDWERIHRDQYRYDSVFPWVCSPNDTHACRVLAYVRNGVIVRMGSDYRYQDYADLYGNKATAKWNPRQCAKGFTFHRVVYAPYRLKHPVMRKGWKEWADAGFPYLTDDLRSKYKFDARGQDVQVRVGWDEAFRYIARGYEALARHYSGDEGKKRLTAEGYEPEMVEATEGAGTRCFKFRGGMGLLGVLGKYGAYRLGNSMALLDAKVRGVDEKEAKGARNWSNYTWHGDQAPGQPFVHGLQTSECDFNDLRFSKLIVMDGKNLVENKMTDSHWFIECMERGAKIVVITPEYGAPASKADYFIPLRPSTDAALFLGITRLMMERGWYDADFVKRFTDFPLLVRTDTLERLRAHELFPGYRSDLAPDGPSKRWQGFTDEEHEKLGDFVVWDAKTNAPRAITRDDVGERLVAKGIDPTLEGKFELEIGGKKVEVQTLWSLYQTHLADYDLDTVHEITHAPKDLVERLAQDLATIEPVAIHQGEGINHWFHATEMNRAAYLPLLLTGNIGKPGAGCHTWAGNYKAALFQGSPWTGPGFKGWVAEDPFHLDLDPHAHGKDVHAHAFTKDEEPAYWNHGDRPLVVDTPKFGRLCLTGQTHMPTPTKALFFNNVNLFNNAKHAYEMLKNVNPRIAMIVGVEIQMTSSIEYADVGLPANSWVEL